MSPITIYNDIAGRITRETSESNLITVAGVAIETSVISDIEKHKNQRHRRGQVLKNQFLIFQDLTPYFLSLSYFLSYTDMILSKDE